MKQRAFEERYGERWDRLESELRRLEQGRRVSLREPARRSAGEDFPALYRAVCRDLALATLRGYSPRLVDRLNALALAGHRVLYTRRVDLLGGILRYVARDFPIRVRRDIGAVSLAAALFVLPGLAYFVAVSLEPQLIYATQGAGDVAGIEAMYDPAAEHIGHDRESQTDLMMFGFYVWNNVGIAFKCFALGVLAGLGAAWTLVSNGVVLGGVAAHLLHVGYGETFFPFVIGHGAFELTAIVLAGAAGLRLGHAVIAPGMRTRVEALRETAEQTLDIVYGVAGMLLIAAALEAFWSSKGSLPTELKLAVGAVLWATVLAYFALAGRGRARRRTPDGER